MMRSRKGLVAIQLAILGIVPLQAQAVRIDYALDAGLNPTKDALAIESSDSPYVNFLVSRADNKGDVRVQKLAKALTSPEVKAFIEQKYQGAVLPAF